MKTERTETSTSDGSQGYAPVSRRTRTLILDSPKDIISAGIGYRYESGDHEVEWWRVWAYAIIVNDPNAHMDPLKSLLKRSKLSKKRQKRSRSEDRLPGQDSLAKSRNCTFACIPLIWGRVIAGARRIFCFRPEGSRNCTFACTHLILGRVIAGARRIFHFKSGSEIITHSDENDHNSPMPSGMLFYYTFTLTDFKVLPEMTVCHWNIEVIESATNKTLWTGTWANEFALTENTPLGKIVYGTIDYLKSLSKLLAKLVI